MELPVSSDCKTEKTKPNIRSANDREESTQKINAKGAFCAFLVKYCAGVSHMTQSERRARKFLHFQSAQAIWYQTPEERFQDTGHVLTCTSDPMQPVAASAT